MSRTHITQFSTITPATEDPITTAQAKAQLRVTYTDEDTNIAAYIAAATQHAQKLTNRQFCTATFKAVTRNWPCDEFVLHKNPVQSVTWVKYYDENNVLQTLATSSYQTEFINEPAIIRILDFPAVYDRPDAIQIQFVAGYGAAAAVPKQIIQAIQLLMAHFYEHREDVIIGTIVQPLDKGSQFLLDLVAVPSLT